MAELVPSDARPSAAGLDAETSGLTPPSDADRRGAFLADVLVELGFADREAVEEAMQSASQSGKTLERYLLENRVLDEAQLSLAIAERNGLDHVDLDRFEVDMAAAEMIGRTAALRYCAVPIAFSPDGALIVAVEDPLDSLGVSDIEVMTRCEVRRAVATASGIRALAERLPEKPSPKRAATAVESRLGSRPDPEPQPESEPEPQPESEPDPEPESNGQQQEEREQPQRTERAAAMPEGSVPGGGLGRLSAELRVLRETTRKADALAITVGRRIEELEGAGERAQRLERELRAAQERNADLERRLSGVDAAAAELRETTEKLEEMYRVLEGSVG
jgi:hypothetical protein